MNLLEREPDGIAELSLTHRKPPTALAQAQADVDIDGM
jgi:hypothetical protein